MKTIYHVEGMSCGGCANSVTNAIKALAPKAQVSVDLEAKRVTVEGVEDDALIGQAVADAGFEFGGRVSG